MFKKWTVFLTYGYIEEAVTWEVDAAHLNKISVSSTWNILYKNLIVSFFLNIFVFALKRFTSCLKQPQSSVAFVHLHNDSLFLQRTNNTRRTYNISLFKLKNWIFSRKLPIFDIFLFIVVYFFVSHIVNQQLIIQMPLKKERKFFVTLCFYHDTSYCQLLWMLARVKSISKVERGN